jgi:hypothetical protein
MVSDLKSEISTHLSASKGSSRPARHLRARSTAHPHSDGVDWRLIDRRYVPEGPDRSMRAAARLGERLRG